MSKWTGWWGRNKLGIAFAGLLLVTVLLWLSWGLFGAQLFRGWICTRHDCEKLGQIGDLFGGVNALFSAAALGLVAFSTDVARRAHADDKQKARESEFLTQIERSYEWAYGVLTGDGKDHPPRPIRLNWLTAARHLVRCEKLSKRLESETYLLLSEEIREYWRHQFYLALSDAALRNPLYFSGGPEGPIDTASALVVVAFSNWDRDYPDPLHGVDLGELIDSGRGMAGTAGRGLEKYLVTLPHIVEQWEARRAARGEPVLKKAPQDTAPAATVVED
ncbi:hypothetical protein SAMN05192589_107121 [Paracidovorax valerianellae]|uniref:Uncharacterized protein n=1 Tax=Paracidovorax valerianellae TaxID=187868 RepID=A0A1G6VU23_9BURK|nr:hypothetical protein [Paracidovorax valerianellae]SDD56335.1 hypothetical protein SAMN05192589_107121 [Paracidovorax valerianellae]